MREERIAIEASALDAAGRGAIGEDMDQEMERPDPGFLDEVGGYHEGGCGTDPDGNFCGECSRPSCAGCGGWPLVRKEGS